MGSQGLADAGSGESGAAAGAVSAPDATAPGASNGNGLPDAGLSPAPTDEESTADAGSPYDSLGTGSGDGFGAWLNEAGCPSGGTFWPRSHDGLAECHQPVTLDVRAGGVGSVFVAQLSGEQFVLSAPVSEACGTLAGHAAVQLLVPDGVDVEFGVDGAADQDWVLVLSDIAQGAAEPGDTVGCDDTTAVRCIDARLSDGCEWQRLVAGEDFVLGAVSLLLAGRAEVGVTSTLRLRLVAPAGAGG